MSFIVKTDSFPQKGDEKSLMMTLEHFSNPVPLFWSLGRILPPFCHLQYRYIRLRDYHYRCEGSVGLFKVIHFGHSLAVLD